MASEVRKVVSDGQSLTAPSVEKMPSEGQRDASDLKGRSLKKMKRGSLGKRKNDELV